MKNTTSALLCMAFFILIPALAWLNLPKPSLLARPSLLQRGAGAEDDGIGFSRAVYDENHRLLRLTLSPDDKYRMPLALDQISPNLVDAVLLKEDRYFYFHPGFNPVALARAALSTVIGGRARPGGSTITMQLARLRYGLKTRTIGGKLRQIFYAVALERHYTKDEILTAYLTLAPFGGNIEGVGAASLVYFGKNASQLSLAEALTLAIIPQSPTARTPEKTSPRATTAIGEARRRLFQTWLKAHPEDREQSHLMDLQLKALSRRQLPFKAPHFVNRVLKETPPTTTLIVTTLNLELQETLERHVRHYIEANRGRGLKNGSALLVDWRTMTVKALVGAVDFFDTAISGQVDGTRARRSPGSALKPFAYALAMDQGIIHPTSLLKDSPASFGGYDPENFDREFLGPLSAREALIKSRNIPAVTLASRLENPSLYGFLRSAGVGGLMDEAFYGLATVLGGAEVTMEEMTVLYAMLANGGIWRAPQILPTTTAPPDKRLLSREASYLVLDILKSATPPEPFENFPKSRDAFPVAWKTGTSYSFRDAWTVGIAGEYVLAVWIGNFDGKGDPALVGRTAAAPLFFKILTAIKPASPANTLLTDIPPPNLDLKRVAVCAVSGARPSPHCKHTTDTWFIPGVSPIKTCDLHREITIDTLSGLRSCDNSAPGTVTVQPDRQTARNKALTNSVGMNSYQPGRALHKGSHPSVETDGRSLMAGPILRPKAKNGGEQLPGTLREVFEFWPSDLASLFKLAGLPRREPPDFAPECAIARRSGTGKAPEIVSPREGVTYVAGDGNGGRDSIAFKAVSDADARVIYWFVNDAYAGAVPRHKALFWPARPGKFTVRAVDDSGRAALRGLTVRDDSRVAARRKRP